MILLFITLLHSLTVHRVDIWNIIEAFRENGLNTLEPYTEVKVRSLSIQSHNTGREAACSGLQNNDGFCASGRETSHP